jgi:hypothetical protein
MIHVIGIPVVLVVGVFVGYKYASRAITAVKAELAKIEVDYAYVEADVKSASLALSNEIKAVVTRIKKVAKL